MNACYWTRVSTLSFPPRFLSLTLSARRSQYRTKCMLVRLPEKYEDLLNLRPSYTYSGQSDITLFIQHVKSLISQQMSLRIDFALIRLNVLPSQDITECASLCKLRRDGDLLTIGDGVIYVFLSAIRANDIDDVLNGIFHLKVSELFSSYCVFINPVDIIEELTNATTPHLNKNIKSKPTRWRTSKPLPSHKTTTRVYAKRVPLERKSQRVLPELTDFILTISIAIAVGFVLGFFTNSVVSQVRRHWLKQAP